MTSHAVDRIEHPRHGHGPVAQPRPSLRRVGSEADQSPVVTGWITL